MKKIIFMLIVGLVINQYSFGRKITMNAAPESVIDSFKLKFPSTKKVVWESIDSINYYALFQYKKSQHVVKFNKEGHWMETIVEMNSEAFPNAVRSMLTDAYPGFEVFEA